MTLNQLIEQHPLELRSGSGPRHGAFVEIGCGVFLYVINQIANTLVAFSVSYLRNGLIEFKELAEMDLLLRMNETRVERDVKASHIQVSVRTPRTSTSCFLIRSLVFNIGWLTRILQPDKRFLLASLRNDSSFTIPSPVTPNITIESDSLLTFSIDDLSGALTLTDAVPAGGSFPRQFSMNAAGNQIAVAVQTNGWVAILKRDVGTGRVGGFVAVLEGLGLNGVVCVLWDERKSADTNGRYHTNENEGTM